MFNDRKSRPDDGAPLDPPRPSVSPGQGTGANTAPPPPPQAQRQAASVIGPDLTITGNVECRGSIQVNGRIEGDVECDSIAVGENGMVKGNIQAEQIRISGTVSGQVRAKEVVISRTAKMHGDVLHESLTVEQGALLEGHCARLKPSEASPRQSKNGEARPASPIVAPKPALGKPPEGDASKPTAPDAH